MVMLLAPAFAKSATWRSGRSIIRCTSYCTSGRPSSTSALRTCGPIDSGGTKWPSMLATWMTRAPASTTSWTWAPRRAKSAARMLGAMRRGLGMTCGRADYALDLDEHRAATVIADRGRRRGHPDDGAVLAAVRAD